MARDTKISLYLWSYPRSQVMKPDFLVARATRKPFSQGNLTFRENQIIRIAAKFHYKIPSQLRRVKTISEVQPLL